jgi:DNA-binding MarR family transcriptional regulator
MKSDNDKDQDVSLFDLLFRLEWLLRRRQVQHLRGRSPVAAPHQGQGRVLALLKLKPELSQKELSTILDIRSQSLGELLGKLERQGLVTRTPSEEDRRSVIVRLTEAGKTASENQEDLPDPEGMFDCLNADEQDRFADYLKRIIAALEAELGPDGPWAREGFGPPPGDPGFGRHGALGGFGRFGGRGFDRGFGGPGFPGHGRGPGHDHGRGHGHGPDEL